MTNTLELFPNEIFIDIFAYLSWDEMLTLFWSLNKRLNSLICSTFSINQSGITIIQPGLSYERFSSELFPLIFNSQLTYCIQHIHLDEINSNSYNLFNNNRNILHYPNLKSLIWTKCYLSELLIESLSLLIQY
ncbi:unnamed protein product [Rotaria socialis]|uniref:F-box domain-containing protein n=1 Tax=Rotaria socialis TaxID=392032 RepID=A0A817PGZ2_9BILA|nr:unnamed protein product [Rotaria socialis]CAF3515007.1 unnamed protein product [Rotaria socialis]CAF3727022.1 unnamed protein product [Rotaria socialis]CAF4227656.1 unnamed protein product [Rotaria socialis]CAF4504205.1 unnamed protein product [Rotaria socialis]